MAFTQSSRASPRVVESCRLSGYSRWAAAQANQISTSEEEHGHGTFTYYLLQELNRTKEKTTVEQLYCYVKPKVEDAARL